MIGAVFTQPTSYVTPDEYLAAERLAEGRNEYADGVVYEVDGAGFAHALIKGNLTRELGLQLRDRQCEVLVSLMKVRLQDSRKFFYPDLVGFCGEPHFYDEHTDVLLNPLLVVEVLSKSTEAFDRGAKFQAYQTIDSLKEYVLVAQEKPFVEQFVRQADGKWTYTSVAGLEASLSLPSVECTLNLSAVYDKVDFDS
jgi:Uma2 family endonuclease